MFDILMYLFENFIHSDVEVEVNHDELTDELTRAGFRQQEIHKALAWLERLADLQDSQKPYLNRSEGHTTRVFTAEETARIDCASRGFLIYLENLGVLDGTTREMVLDRVMELDMAEVTLDDLKWVVLMVLFNVPGCEEAYDQMEGLLFEEAEGLLH
ncbi:Protein Smg [Pseudidiomarina piscicola]|uniref:Protein Smg homolog n=1 Tax=Pseudidiomarina piscicola TaxID=2614830 RepID=A0A6S6WRH1_9GAMM|nr:DUF494 family protein [Pseudidiomarina piscicola]CAB0150821.1 Protein Smg [Pseudidiomarina piscicola]VZT40326.1 Protein Smg [Pseudomonas aeruginosa]